MYHWYTKTYPRRMFEQIPGHADEILFKVRCSMPQEPMEIKDEGGCSALVVALSAQRMVSTKSIVYVVMLSSLRHNNRDVRSLVNVTSIVV